MATGKAGTLAVSGTRTAFVSFDLSSLPAGLVVGDITSARLRVYFPSALKPGDVNIHAVTSAWDERLAATQPSISPAAVAQIPAAMVLAKKFIEVDVTTTVQGWFTTPATNFGFAFVATAPTSVTLGAKEGSGSGYPCELEVEIDRGSVALALALPGLTTRASMNGPTFLSFDVIGGSTVNTIANGVTEAR